MKKILAVFSFLVVMLLILLPFPKSGQDGSFNVFSRLAYCRTQAACLHEIGHALDARGGWISQTPEFSQALQMYLYVELRKEPLTELPASIMEITYRGGEGNVKREIYAFLFQYTQGRQENMPEGLRLFYDWDKAALYLTQLRSGQRFYFFAWQVVEMEG